MVKKSKNNKKDLTVLKEVFYTLIFCFLAIFAFMFFPERLAGHGELMFVPWIFFSLLGVILFLKIREEKVGGKLGLFLKITAFSAAGFLVLVVLHNFFYALAILTERILVVRYLMNFFEVSFFLLGVLGAPIGFLIGAIGSFFLFRKK